MFISKSTPITLPLHTFIMYGHMYLRTDTTEHMTKLFVPSKIQDVEVITGYLETKPTNRMCIVSNYPREHSVMKEVDPATETTILKFAPSRPIKFDTMEERKPYLDTVVSSSLDAMHNTSNIPYVTPPRGDGGAIDYGVISPTTRILANCKLNRGIYFCPINIDYTGTLTGYSMIFHNFIVNDVVAIQNTFEKRQNVPTMNAAMELINNCERYCIVIYTTAQMDVKVSSFTAYDIDRLTEICHKLIKLKVFYDSPPVQAKP